MADYRKMWEELGMLKPMTCYARHCQVRLEMSICLKKIDLREWIFSTWL